MAGGERSAGDGAQTTHCRRGETCLAQPHRMARKHRWCDGSRLVDTPHPRSLALASPSPTIVWERGSGHTRAASVYAGWCGNGFGLPGLPAWLGQACLAPTGTTVAMRGRSAMRAWPSPRDHVAVPCRGDACVARPRREAQASNGRPSPTSPTPSPPAADAAPPRSHRAGEGRRVRGAPARPSPTRAGGRGNGIGSRATHA